MNIFELNALREDIRDKFSEILFVEGNHTYKYRDDRTFSNNLPSVSAKVKNFEIPFDKSIAKHVARASGESETMVLTKWDNISKASCDFGTMVHDFAEEYVTENYHKVEYYQQLGVVQYFLDHPQYVLIATELPVFHRQLHYAGTFDLLLYDTNEKTLIIADWKTNKDLFKNYKGQKLLEPFEDVLATPLNKYKIQLNLYDMCFQEKEIVIGKRIVIWLPPDSVGHDNGKYYREFEVEDLKDKLTEYYVNNS